MATHLCGKTEVARLTFLNDWMQRIRDDVGAMNHSGEASKMYAEGVMSMAKDIQEAVAVTLDNIAPTWRPAPDLRVVDEPR